MSHLSTEQGNPHVGWLRTAADRLYKQQRDYDVCNTCDEAANELERLQRQYCRAILCLQEIAALSGTTKRKQAGCEMAAHMLAQLKEPREPT